MEVALRKRVRGGWWSGVAGLGDEEPDYTDFSDYFDSIFEPDPVYTNEPTGYYPPGSVVGPQLTPEDQAQRAAGDQWLNTIPNALNAAGKVILSASQLSTGISEGAVVPSSYCPSGYMVGGHCVQPQAGGQLIPGLSNNTLLLIGGGVLVLSLLTGGKRR